MKLKRDTELFFVGLLIIACTHEALAQTSPANKDEITPLRIVALDDKAAPSGWKRYQFGDPILFSAILPNPPQTLSNKFESKTEAPLIARLYIAPSITGVYGVSYMEDLGAEGKPKSEESRQKFIHDFIKGFANGFIKGLEARGVTAELKEIAQRKVRIGGIDRYEHDLNIGAFTGRAQVVFVGSKIYAAFALWKPESSTSERTAFFNSLKISPIP